MNREEKNFKRKERIKASIKKFMKRKKFWASIPFVQKDNKKLYRLKTTGNPFKLPAWCLGNPYVYLDAECFYKTPYHYTKSEWKARKLKEEIDQFKKGRIDLETLDNSERRSLD